MEKEQQALLTALAQLVGALALTAPNLVETLLTLDRSREAATALQLYMTTTDAQQEENARTLEELLRPLRQQLLERQRAGNLRTAV